MVLAKARERRIRTRPLSRIRLRVRVNTTIQYLEDQAARAERLAKRITDTITVEKLLSFAGERRREVEAIAGKRRQA